MLFIPKSSFVVKNWQKMAQSYFGYRSILAIFGIFKLFQKHLKLQLKFEKSCQKIETFQKHYYFDRNGLLPFSLSQSSLKILGVLSWKGLKECYSVEIFILAC